MKNRITQDMKQAMRDGHKIKKDLLRTVLGELDRAGKDLDNKYIDNIIRKMYQNALTFENYEEAEILEEYLVPVMSYEQIQVSVRECFKQVNEDRHIKNFGIFMKKFVELNQNKSYDGKEVAAVLRKNLLNT